MNLYWYWISFADPDSGENLGCCNVQAFNKAEAIMKTHILKINPGGEAMIVTMPKPELEPDKLISKEQLLAEGFKKLKDEAAFRGVDPESLPADYICPDCNNMTCNRHN